MNYGHQIISQDESFCVPFQVDKKKGTLTQNDTDAIRKKRGKKDFGAHEYKDIMKRCSRVQANHILLFSFLKMIVCVSISAQ